MSTLGSAALEQQSQSQSGPLWLCRSNIFRGARADPLWLWLWGQSGRSGRAGFFLF